MKRKEHPWYLLSGSIFGVILGILISWVFFPVVYVDTLPSSLRDDYKDQYRFMIAASFASNHDLTRASARMNTISDDAPLISLNQQIQSMQVNKYPLEQILMMQELFAALQIQASYTPTATITSTSTLTTTSTLTLTSTSTITSTSTLTSTLLPSSTPTDIPTYSPTFTALPSSSPKPAMIQTLVSTPTKIVFRSPTPTNTRLPKATSTTTSSTAATSTLEILPSQTLRPIATLPLKINRTSTPTPEKIFVLAKKTGFCDQANPGLLQIFLKKTNSAPAAGVEIVISWNSGEDHFFTGLKPELGFGYADYKMADNIEYTLSLSNGNTRVTNLKTSACSGSQGGKYLSGLVLEFKQP